MARIVVIDDDHTSCSALARLLMGEGHEVDWFTSGEEAISQCLQREPQFLICDWILENGLEGASVARAIWIRWPLVRIIFITGLPVEQLSLQNPELPVIHIFEKPVLFDELLGLVNGSADHGGRRGMGSS